GGERRDRRLLPARRGDQGERGGHLRRPGRRACGAGVLRRPPGPRGDAVSVDPSAVRRPEPPDPDRPEGAPAGPGPVFAVLKGAHVPHAAAPTMSFTLGVSE